MPKLKIFVATVYGGALDVAEQIMPLFEEAGFDVEILEDPTLEDLADDRPDLAFFCISTTGSGDFPGNFMEFSNALNDRGANLNAIRYGLIAMGDSSYGDTFCGAGRKLDALLQEYGASRIGERLEIDATETFMADDVAVPWVERWLAELER